MGYPDWTAPIVFVLQEGELWPITEWVSRQGQEKMWFVWVTVPAMGSAGVDVYTVPAGKKLYLMRYWSALGALEEHILAYKTPTVTLFDGVVDKNTALLLPFSPPITLVAGKTLRLDYVNGDNLQCVCKATIQAYELPV
jgi:hypothetical protein